MTYPPGQQIPMPVISCIVVDADVSVTNAGVLFF
jgi:hypothetical protein